MKSRNVRQAWLSLDKSKHTVLFLKLKQNKHTILYGDENWNMDSGVSAYICYRRDSLVKFVEENSATAGKNQTLTVRDHGPVKIESLTVNGHKQCLLYT